MIYKSSKIASKSPPKCLKPVSNPYMMSKHDLAHFWKNRKKSIFEKKNSSMHQQNFQNFDFFAKYRQNKIVGAINIPKPPTEKNLSSSYDVFRILSEIQCWSAIFAKIHIFTFRSFWIQKGIKNQKFFWFSDSPKYHLSLDINIVGDISKSKKVGLIEIGSKSF